LDSIYDNLNTVHTTAVLQYSHFYENFMSDVYSTSQF